MLTVSQVARKAKVAPNTVRNHVRDFPDLFSEAARGFNGDRRFNSDDVEAICSLVALKDSGMPLAEAAARLRSQEAPTVIDVAATPLQHAASPQTALEASHPLMLVRSDLQHQIDAVVIRQDKQERKRDIWLVGTGIWIGMIIMAAIFFSVWLLNAWWYGG